MPKIQRDDTSHEKSMRGGQIRVRHVQRGIRTIQVSKRRGIRDACKVKVFRQNGNTYDLRVESRPCACSHMPDTEACQSEESGFSRSYLCLVLDFSPRMLHALPRVCYPPIGTRR